MARAQLGDPKLEIRVLKTLCSEKRDIRDAMFSRIKESSFSYPPAQEAFVRINNYAKHESIPAWDAFLSDTKLSEDTIQALTMHKQSGASTKADVEMFASQVEEFRSRRILYEAIEDSYDGIRRGDIATETLLDSLSDKITSARATGNTEDHMVHLGSRNGVLNLINIFTKMRNGESHSVIPTGMESFDKLNGGVPRGSNFVMGAPSGEGKSVLVLNVILHMALSGVKICLVSLEMNLAEVWLRAVSAWLAIPLNDILMKRITASQWDEINRCLLMIHASLAISGGGITIYTPEVDPNIEELLAGLKPYGYDVIGIDYVTLLRGFDGEQFWLKIGNGLHVCKRHAEINGTVMIPVIQADEDGEARFSNMIKDNASLMWTWGKVKDDKKKNTNKIETFDIMMKKSRNQTPFIMKMYRRFDIMQMTDNMQSLSKRWVERIPDYDRLEKLSNLRL